MHFDDDVALPAQLVDCLLGLLRLEGGAVPALFVFD